MCGEIRDVRPELVEGFDVLACARHPSGDVVLEVPPGHHSTVTLNVAGYLNGYTVQKSTSADLRAAHRAASNLAAAQGRPAPEPPFDPADHRGIDRRLVEAFTKALGPTGWEIADWDREGRAYVVKVYTDFGWAGFLEGRLDEITDELRALRSRAAAVAETLRCPTCDARLDPFGEGSPCGCGTVVWRPAFWTTAWDSMSSALAYLDGAPDPETAAALARITSAMAGPGQAWDLSEDDFNSAVEAFQQLAPAARWELINDRPVAVIPVGATFEPGPAGELLAAADALGYHLALTTDRRICFQRTGPAADLPTWFLCTSTGDDGYQVTAAQPGWTVVDDDSSEHWRAQEETDDWWITRSGDLRQEDWEVDHPNLDFDGGSPALAAVGRIAGLSPATLRVALTDADRAIQQARALLDAHYARLRASG